MERVHLQCFLLCLPTWLFWTVHNKWHKMKAFVILNHSRSPFLSLTLLIWGKINFCESLSDLLEYFLDIQKLPPDHPFKSHDWDHQWADLVVAWLVKDIYYCGLIGFSPGKKKHRQFAICNLQFYKVPALPPPYKAGRVVKLTCQYDPDFQGVRISRATLESIRLNKSINL